MSIRVRYSVLALSLGACGGGGGTPEPVALKPLTAAPLTTDQTIELVHAVELQANSPNAKPYWLNELLTEGFGATQLGPAATVTDYTLDGSAAPAPAAAPTLLSRFVHLSDTQLADDESPTRVVDFDEPTLTYAAFRPHEAYMCRVLNAMVRTINKVHEAKPIDFVLLGGDNSDNAQTNEVGWFTAILDGSPRVKCDSGAADDPKRGSNNDPKDPFSADGLTMPWKWVTGNHDVLTQGNFVAAAMAMAYVGTEDGEGTRTWTKLDLPTIHDDIVPDPDRAPLSRTQLMQTIGADKDGHGLDTTAMTSGKAYYHFDVGTTLRFVVMDTAAETGGDDGVLHRADLMTYVKPALDEAETEGRYVILVSHHGPTTLSDGSGFGGTMQGDAVLAPEWRTFLGGYPHVMLHLGAHTHLYRAASSMTFFEAENASLADWPGQVRLFEIWDQGDYLQISGVPVDYNDEGDALVTEARMRQAMDFASGWVDPSVGPGAAGSQAISLWFPKIK